LTTVNKVQHAHGGNMGDKNPKSLGKNKKQKDGDKAKSVSRAKEQVDAKKKVNAPNTKK
jgi:hypothetical protein